MNEKRLLESFLDYVKIDSESGNEKAVAERLRADLEALGLRVETDGAGPAVGSNTGNLYAFLEGDSSLEPLILSAHIDTVTPGVGIEPVVEDGVITSRGETILGGDDKSGVCAILEALRVLREQKLPHRPAELVFTVMEERGLLGSKHLDYSRLAAKRAVVFDSSGDVGKIIVSAPGHLNIKASIHGKKAHAGICPEQGVSAIAVAADAVSRMRLGRLDGETTANIGSLRAEGADNIVCDLATLSAEARSQNEAKLDAQGEHMVACLREACERHGATLDCELIKAYGPYCFADSDPLVVQVRTALESIGVTPFTASTGGGSDANNMNLNGVHAVVVGTGMDRVHTTDERLTVENLGNCARLALALLKKPI
ncbi:M20/M25/M40 family metallo-hydrolase [Feifania hominis]|uniref:M20/M25/M40 family metallo-hydrolase n=1 Tax=Feifania hominis TaxID=2763660 RepID=A0A926DGD2_9FIRM|nr:M20/M25/M40 family metallo-hydrolase [Feifania hominis]MBC8536804.1 M20/M25/M40 family metallo-hydrolase [Feifania hominis]